ncbi:MAG: CNNM domain-containing protein [Planctomycetota bacterium]
MALGASFLCSVLEAVLLSTSASYVEVQIEKGRRSARVMRRLIDRENIDRSIAAILTLNTIAHTVGAAGAGAQAAGLYGSEYIGLIGAVLTVLILVVSEIIPKTLGAVYWKGLNGFSAYATLGLVRILAPIVWACQLLTDLLKPKRSEPSITRSELEILARLGQEEGAIGAGESRVFRNLLRLDQVPVKEILTPRTVLFTLEEERTAAEVVENTSLSYSRIPIHDESHDDISRFVLRFDILEAVTDGRGETTLAELARPLRPIPETSSVAQLLERFVEKQEHMFLVVDEYGGTAGIVTLEDAIESLLGAEITDESDLVTDLRALAQERARRRGRWVAPRGRPEE